MWKNNLFFVTIAIVTLQVINTLPNFRSSARSDQVFNNKCGPGNRSSYRFPYRYPRSWVPRSSATSQLGPSYIKYNSSRNSSGPVKFSLTTPSRRPFQQNTHDEVLPAQYPKYTGTLPPYVIAVQKSVTRYRRLLTGLSLYNLGRTGQIGNILNKTIKYKEISSKTISKKDTHCTFNLVTQNTTQILKIPCEIVTSFYIKDSNASSASVTASPAVYFTATALKSNAKSYKAKSKTNITNPLGEKYKGVAIDITGMLCSVMIKDKNTTRSTITPCRVLNQYAASLKWPSSPYSQRVFLQKRRRP